MWLIRGRDELFMRIFPMTSDSGLTKSAVKGGLERFFLRPFFRKQAFLRRCVLLLTIALNTVVGASEGVDASVECDLALDTVDCGSAYSATMDGSGKLWISYVRDQYVYVSQSDDKGKIFSRPVKVNKIAEDVEHNGENRPKIIVTSEGEVLLSWTLKTSNRYTGEIRFARSNNNGETFSEPKTVNDDGLTVGHRFDSMFLTKSGHLYLTWIDKRELHASIQTGQNYAGAAIYYAVSDDYGRSFSPNYPVSSNSCECCRIAMAPSGEDGVAIVWRQIYDEEIRDHAFAVLSPEGKVGLLARASFDDWYINACPHHGPAMEIAATENDYHMTWFSNGNIHQGIYYARYNALTGVSEAVMQVDGMPGAGHPDLKEFDGKLYLVWKGFDGEATQLSLIVSSDNGETWSSVQTLYSTESASDYPLLVRDKDALFLSWHSNEHGYSFSRLAAQRER
jgi:hypothetical protein